MLPSSYRGAFHQLILKLHSWTFIQTGTFCPRVHSDVNMPESCAVCGKQTCMGACVLHIATRRLDRECHRQIKNKAFSLEVAPQKLCDLTLRHEYIHVVRHMYAYSYVYWIIIVSSGAELGSLARYSKRNRSWSAACVRQHPTCQNSGSEDMHVTSCHIMSHVLKSTTDDALLIPCEYKCHFRVYLLVVWKRSWKCLWRRQSKIIFRDTPNTCRFREGPRTIDKPV